MRAISQEISQSSIPKISLKITYWKICPNPPGANELDRKSDDCGSLLDDSDKMGCTEHQNAYMITRLLWFLSFHYGEQTASA